MNANVVGAGNTAVGANALLSNDGKQNVAVGFNSLRTNTAGFQNTATGFEALKSTTGNLNTGVGYQAMKSGTGGVQNTAIGASADVAGAINNATAIGFGATVNASNTMHFGNAAVTNIEFPNNATVAVAGAPTLNLGTAVVNFVNTSNVNGNVKITGNLQVTGTIVKGSGNFMIDHPLDPENKYLYHSFVESPDMMNIYNGNAVLDENGQAEILLPDWFEALNKDFRYQLTAIGGFAPIYIEREIAGNSFKIAGGRSGLKVSWQVTGIRKDPYANTYRSPVEVDKPENERGTYLHPEAYGKSTTGTKPPLKQEERQ